MRCLGKVALLVLDDSGLQGFSAEERRDLLEIVEARYGLKSILIASQIPVEHWPGTIGEPTITDAVLDRVIHNGIHIELKGEFQRKRNRPPPLGGSKNEAGLTTGFGCLWRRALASPFGKRGGSARWNGPPPRPPAY